MNDVETRITEYLKEAGVEFRLLDHEAAGSAEEYQRALGTRMEQQAKALFVRVKKPGNKSFAVVALQAQKQADLRQISRLLRAFEVRLATADQLREVTGCSFGELPPFGVPFGIPLVLDRDLLAQPEIYFNIGSLERSMAVNPSVLESLESPTTF